MRSKNTKKKNRDILKCINTKYKYDNIIDK